MELVEQIDCPLCTIDAKAHLKTEIMNVLFRGNEYRITHYYYRCENCNDEFETEESLSRTLAQIPNYPGTA